MPQKLYGIAEFHPPVLLRYAWNLLSDDVQKFYGNEIRSLQLQLLYDEACLRVSSIAQEQYQLQKGVNRILGKGRLADLQKASRAAKTAAEIIAKESQIIGRLCPKIVYLERTLGDLYDNIHHPLIRIVSETGGQIVWLGAPEGYKQKSQELQKRLMKSPRSKALREEWRMIIEEKDFLWGNDIPEIAARYDGNGLLVVGRDHLIESDGFRGLTASLLKEKGFEVEISLAIDRREIAEQIGIHYDNLV